jgi:hypothetical protein
LRRGEGQGIIDVYLDALRVVCRFMSRATSKKVCYAS